MSHVPLRWIPRRTPLAVAAVAASGTLATSIADRVLARDDAALGALRGVAGIAWIVLLGAEAELPWADGVTLLGVDPRAPALLIPTALDTDLPIALVARAMLAARREGQGAPPLAVLPDDRTMLSVADARALDRRALSAWVGSRRDRRSP
jgi:hypothetical protein